MNDLLSTTVGHLSADLGQRIDRQWRSNLFTGALAVVIICAVIAILFAFEVPPLQDYGDWTYQGYLLHRLMIHAPAPVIIKPWPVPNSVSEVALALLGFVFDPVMASRAWIIIYLLAACLVMFLASCDRAGHIDCTRFVLLIGLGVVGAPFWTGEINYQVGLLLFTLYVVLCKRDREPGLLFFASYAVIVFFCHALCLGMVLAYEACRSLRKHRILQLGLASAPVAVLALWYKLADPRTETATLDTTPHLHGLTDNIGYVVYQIAKTGPYHNFYFGGMGDYDRAPALFWAGTAANLVFAACMCLLLLSWIRASWHDLSHRNELVAAFVFMLLAVANPAKYLGIANMGERLMLPALVLGVVSMPYRSIVMSIGAALMAVSAIVFICFALLASQVPDTGAVPSNAIVSNPTGRFHVLFWHKSFQFVPQAEAAAQAWAQGIVPRRQIAFETGILMRRPDPTTRER